MHLERVTDENLSQYEAFIQSHPKGHFMQSRAWGKLKSDWRWEAFFARDEQERIVGSMALLIRKLPGLPYTLSYGCRGPVCDGHNPAVVKALLNHAKHVAKHNKSYLIKLDPDVLSSDETFLELAKECGFALASQSKNFETIQPRFVFRLNIADKTADELMADFHHKWRYNIRLAERKGVTAAVENDAVAAFTTLMVETGVRDGFVTRSEGYFRKMLEVMGEHARLYMAKIDGEYVAGTLAIHYGDKVWYLYGASDTAHRNFMPSYLLQWHMIQWAKELNCAVYDFRGVSGDVSEDNPLYGLYRFKKGFGGDFTEFVGELDCVLHPLINKAFIVIKRTNAKLRAARYMRKNKKNVPVAEQQQ